MYVCETRTNPRTKRLKRSFFPGVVLEAWSLMPYVVPFILYFGLTWIAARYPEHYAWSYPAVVVIVGVVMFRPLYRRDLLKPHVRIVPGVVVGLAGIALWIGISHLEWDQRIGALLPSWDQRPAFD